MEHHCSKNGSRGRPHWSLSFVEAALFEGWFALGGPKRINTHHCVGSWGKKKKRDEQPIVRLLHGWDHSSKMDLGFHVAVGQNQWYHFGVGAPPVLVYFSEDWDVHWGYDLEFDPLPCNKKAGTTIQNGSWFPFKTNEKKKDTRGTNSKKGRLFQAPPNVKS